VAFPRFGFVRILRNFPFSRPVNWIAGAPVLLILAAGCGQDSDAQGTSDEHAIFGGIRDDDTSTKSAVVALRIRRGNNYDLCSASVLAPNVLLTARHCVGEVISVAVACDENGNSTNGDHVAGDEPPQAIGVFVGTSPSFGKTPTAMAKSIYSPPGRVFCNSDISLIVLDHPLDGIQPFALRLSANAREGERIRAVGYGRNDAKVPMGTRFRKDQVPVLAIGRGISQSHTHLGEFEFEVGESICEGDSGGPAISETTGAVIGVVSRGGNCGEDSGNVYTATVGFKALVDKAFAEAGGAPIIEANTPSEGDLGPSSDPGAPPPATSPPPKSGCSASPVSAPSGVAALGFLFALVALARRRR
jgi:uncharacterized protein (TIGR03382 family)